MLHLEVPPQSNLPGVDTRPGPLSRWVNELPYADAPACAHVVLARLREINTQKLPGRDRARLMAAFQQAYNRLHEPLRTAHANRESGHLESRELRLLEQLTEQMLHGYKYIINESQHERAGWRKPTHLHTAVNHAAHLIVLLLASRYAEYIPTEQRLWKEATELLEYSEIRKIPAQRAEGFPFVEHLAVDRAFRQLAALRLADPFRLPPDRVWDTLEFLGTHLDSIRLQPGERPIEELPPGQFPLCRDCEPNEKLHLPEELGNALPWRQIDLEGLIAVAQGFLQQIENGGTGPFPGLSSDRTVREHRQLLLHLVRQWLSAPARKHERRAYREITQIRTGLSEIWRLYNQDRPFRSIEWQPEDDLLDGESEAPEPAPPPAREFACTLDNRSAGGVGIRYARSKLSLRVGDLVAIAIPDSRHGRVWFTALVRWVMNEGKEASAGLHYIARNVCAMAARPASAEAGTPLLPVLKCEAGSGERRTLILLSPRGLYDRDRILELRGRNGLRQQVTCQRFIEAANGIERFTILPEE